jgi:hypothetical protein
MHISNLGKAIDLYERLDDIDTDINDAEKRLGVTLHGKYQENDIVDIARPVIIAELVRRRDAVLKELQALGITLTTKEPDESIVIRNCTGSCMSRCCNCSRKGTPQEAS